jgi:membrane protein DedA with SNARE-associated domain
MMSPFHVPWLGEAVSLFFAPFLHEDMAILAGAAYVTEAGLPRTIAFASLFGGVAASDFAIYGLGRLASRVPYLRRILITERVQKARQWLVEHLVAAVVVTHLVPGLLFPTFVACGWFRVPARRFVLASASMAAVYVSAMLFLMLHFGAAIRESLGYWVWPALAAVVLGIGALKNARPSWASLSKAASGLNKLRAQTMTQWRRNIARVSHRGMPAIGDLQHHASLAEYIPPTLFYFPLIVQWLLLAARYRSLTLPTASNPLIESGGFWGESKSACMRLVAASQRKWFADFVTLRRTAEDAGEDYAAALSALEGAKLGFPLVAKPDIGWQGYGVRLLANDDELMAYVEHFPKGETIIFQRLVPYDGEAGVLYVRMPGEAQGKITSLTFRYFPYVVGDGVSTVAQLIMRDPRASFRAAAHLGTDRYHLGVRGEALETVPPKDEVVRLSFIGSIRVGAVYRDASEYITQALTARFDEISRAIPEFYVGRYDIRFRSLEKLQAGEDFAIIEINGAGSEVIHVWDPDVPLRRTYKILFDQQSLLFRIGSLNRARGFRPQPFRKFVGDFERQRRLIERYPPSS